MSFHRMRRITAVASIIRNGPARISQPPGMRLRSGVSDASRSIDGVTACGITLFRAMRYAMR